MAMSRKNYIKIAKVVKGVQSNLRAGYFIDGESYFDFVHDLCVIFEDDNDSFNADKFKEATDVIWRTLMKL